MTRRMILVLILLAGLSQASVAVVETQHLIVSAEKANLSDARLNNLADQAQATFERVLAFWSVDSGMDQFGKIRVIFDAPRRRDYYTAVVDLTYRDRGRRVSDQGVSTLSRLFERDPNTACVAAQRLAAGSSQ